MLDEVESRAKAALDAIPRAHDPAAATKAQPLLRQRLERALGHSQFPRPAQPRARVTGTIARPGYRIEKIVFESLPGVEVPAHLYLPEGLQTRAPAILFYNGHWWDDSKSRPGFQSFCINMARLGFAVFSFDPFGQGERGVSQRDHRRVEALLAGISQQGFAEYETQRALEYLLSRKEVDAERIGMTGASGGGYNTWITAALDPRIKVAVPVVGTSDFYKQIHFVRANDWYQANEHCHFIPGLLQFADNHEFVAMVAPRPLLIINATEDLGFPIGGVHEYGAALYRSFGTPAQIAYFEDASTGHGYQQKKREAAYGWFLRWLMQRGDGSPYPEPPTETLPFDAAELRCFEDGKKRPAGPGMIAAVGKIVDGISTPPAPPGAEPLARMLTPARALELQRRTVQRIEVPLRESRVTLAGFLLRPEKEKGLLLAIDDGGKEELARDPVVRRAYEEGWAVCGMDPRGIGELATEKDGWLAAVSLLLGENFVKSQAGDLLAAAQSLARTPEYRGKPAALYARGHNAGLAAVHALAEAQRRGAPAFAWYLIRNTFLTYRHFLDRPRSLERSYTLLDRDFRERRFTAFDQEIPFRYFHFDALRRFDIPQLLRSVKSPGLVAGPINGDWQPLSNAEAKALMGARIPVVAGIELDGSAALDKLLSMAGR
jgi:dienelactone hydrolase